MNAKNLESARVRALTRDEEWNVSAQVMAAAARGPLRRASLEDLVALRDEEARLNVRRRLIQFVIVLTLFLFLA